MSDSAVGVIDEKQRRRQVMHFGHDILKSTISRRKVEYRPRSLNSRHQTLLTEQRIRLSAGIESVIVEVADLGIGISLQDRSRVFKKFFKLDKSGNVHGAGLGLSIAKRIIEAHGGEIGIQANAPRGTRVVVEIPRTLMTEDQKSAATP